MIHRIAYLLLQDLLTTTMNVDYSIKDLEKVLPNIGGIIKKVDISRLTGLGENYLSLVFRIDIEVESEGQTKTVKAVAKCLPPLEEISFNAYVMHIEIKWYAEIVPLLKKSGNELDIGTDFYPEFLGGRFSLNPMEMQADRDAVLILKNLNPEGYKNEDRHIGFDVPTAKAILTSLAKFHALPLAMKFKQPKSFKILKDFLDNSRPERPPPKKVGEVPFAIPRSKLFDKIIKLPGCEDYRAKIEALGLKLQGPEDWHKPGQEPWNTVTHRDFWVNNIMVKPREGKWPNVKIVDFQVCAYSSFAKDLIFFLLTSIKNDILMQEIDNLLRYYYEQLTSILNQLGIPELKLSYEKYLSEVKRVADESEVDHAIFFTTIIFGEKGKGLDLLAEKADLSDHVEYVVDNMSEKLKGKLETLVKLCVRKGWL